MSRLYFDTCSYARNGDACRIIERKKLPQWDGSEVKSANVKAALLHLDAVSEEPFASRAKTALRQVEYQRLRELKFIRAFSDDATCPHMHKCACLKRYHSSSPQ